MLNDRDYTMTIKSVSNDAVLYCCKAEDFNAAMRGDDRTWHILSRLIQEKDNNTEFKIGRAYETMKAQTLIRGFKGAKANKKAPNKSPSPEPL